jgi:hypothetical protein
MTGIACARYGLSVRQCNLLTGVDAGLLKVTLGHGKPIPGDPEARNPHIGESGLGLPS